MLMPKRVKRRKVFRGRMKGAAHRGNFLAYGEYGLQATEPCWVTSQQIEAARIALTRYTKRGGQVWIKIFPDKPVTEKLKPEWVPARALRNTGLQLSSPAACCLKSLACPKKPLAKPCAWLPTSCP